MKDWPILEQVGAGVTIINSANLIDKLGLKILKCNIRIKTADNTEYTCLGYVNIPYTYGSRTCVVPTIVVPEITKPLILGVDFLDTFDFKLMIPETTETDCPFKAQTQNSEIPEVPLMLAEDFFSDDDQTICFQIEPVDQNAVKSTEIDESLEMPTLEIPSTTVRSPMDIDTEHLLTEDQRDVLFESVMELPATANGSLGRTSILKHSIDLIPGTRPRKLPMYKWSPIVEKVIDEEVERMRKLGVVEECSGPIEFLNPLLPIKKQYGKWKICLDSRRLNSCTKRDDFPFPNMMGILQRIQKSRYFSVIDLSESYYQVSLTDSAKDKTAFRTNKGLFRFVVMPFGLTNAPATMARLMTKVLGHDLEPYVYVYLDDIIITSLSFEHHCELIKKVAKRLRIAGLTINLQKSKFCQRKIRYL